MVWPAVIGAAGSLLSGVFKQRSARKAADKANAALWAREDTAIQRRVEDAGKAGINPLAAIGATGASSSYATPVGSTETGSAVGDAMQSLGKGMMQLEMEKKRAEIDAIRTATRVTENEAARKLTTNSGKVITIPGHLSPQEAFEREYGEIGGELHGITRLADDFVVKPFKEDYAVKRRQLNRYVKSRKRYPARKESAIFNP